jgi:hypothetical protein
MSVAIMRKCRVLALDIEAELFENGFGLSSIGPEGERIWYKSLYLIGVPAEWIEENNKFKRYESHPRVMATNNAGVFMTVTVRRPK